MTQQFNNNTTHLTAPLNSYATAPFNLHNSRKSSLDLIDPTAFHQEQQNKLASAPYQYQESDQMISLDFDLQNNSAFSPDHPFSLEEEEQSSTPPVIPQENNNELFLGFSEKHAPLPPFFQDLSAPQMSSFMMKPKQQQQLIQTPAPIKKKIAKKQFNPFSIQKKVLQDPLAQKTKKKTKNYDKNICRYLTRKTIRCFSKMEYQEQVLKYTKNNYELYFDATEYFVRKIEQFTGFRVLKEFLDIQSETDPEVRQYKIVFKEFYKWFLKERIARYIYNGEMEDKLMYIKYKNEVMLKYTDSLNEWTSNKNKKQDLIRAGKRQN